MNSNTKNSCVGFVSIVGAGPGALDLLTLRALDRIERAEVVVHDRLIDAEVLARIPPQAERIYVGKASGAHAMPQEKIHEVLIAHARQGKRVVRLKGGDPFVFGRGGEEVLALQEAGLAFEVVPGVTADSGCSAAAGIPLTHRGLATSVTFLPGYLADETAHLDWTSLARPNQTRVFYMGVERLARIAEQLIAHGLSVETPAAIVRDGTKQTQTVLATSLQELVRLAPGYGPQPGLLIVGEAVALSPHFDQTRVQIPVKPQAPVFTAADRSSLRRIIEARRDMRHFVPGAQVSEEVITRILSAAHHAPSVGLMQPWRYVRITDAALRASMAGLVDDERAATANALDQRGAEFLNLKVEGVRECAELWVVVLPPDDGTVFGRRTMPRETALCSLGASVENLWLAARAENLGLGWVSLFDPQRMSDLLKLPQGAQAMGILCIGPVPEFYAAPMLEQVGWRQGRAMQDLMSENVWVK